MTACTLSWIAGYLAVGWLCAMVASCLMLMDDDSRFSIGKYPIFTNLVLTALVFALWPTLPFLIAGHKATERKAQK